MKLYLDVCCLNRPFDDQAQTRIHIESESIIAILSYIQNNKWDLILSDIIEYEVSNLLDINKREKVKIIFELCGQKLKLNSEVEKRAHQLQIKGVDILDSLHLAVAEFGKVDFFLTTDDKLLKKLKNISINVKVLNPVNFLMEVINK